MASFRQQVCCSELPRRMRLTPTYSSPASPGWWPGYFALLVSWANVMPPSVLMAFSPMVPSEAVPERITPIARLPRVFGQRAKEVVDRQVLRPRLPPSHQVECPVSDAHHLVGGNDVDVVWFHRHALFHLRHGHRGGLGKQLGQQALMSGVEVLHQHQCQAGIRWQGREQFAERFEASGGSTDPYNRVMLFLCRGSGAEVGILRPRPKVGSGLRRTGASHDLSPWEIFPGKPSQ